MTEYSNIIDMEVGRRQRQSVMDGVGSSDDSPDDAARAMELSQATGVPAEVIHGDLEGFESQNKSTMAGQIISRNKYISDYISQSPLHAKVSNDDWGNLDELSRAIETYNAGKPEALSGEAASLIRGGAKGYEEGVAAVRQGGDPIVESLKGFLEGFGKQAPGSWQFEDGEWKRPTSFSEGFRQTSAMLLGLVPEAAFRSTQGLIGGIKGASSSLAKNAGMSEQESERLSRDLTGMVETELSGVRGQLPSALGGEAKTAATGIESFLGKTETRGSQWAREVDQFIKEREEFEQARARGEDVEPGPMVKAFMDKVEPFVKAGEMPPVGVNAQIDKIHKEQAKSAADTFKDVEQAFDKSNTTDRAPQAAKAFLETHPDSSVELSADGLRKVYEEDGPVEGDGKLGDLSYVIDGWQAAISTGSGIKVPLADWLTKVSPELRKELVDDLIHTDGGISKNEGKEIEPPAEAEEPKEGEVSLSPEATTLEAVKDSAGVRPLPLEEPPEPKVEEGKSTADLVKTAFTKKDYSRWFSKVEAEQAAEADFLKGLNEALIRRRQSKEWKEKASAIRKSVLEDIEARPDVALDNFLRNGILDGGKVPFAKIDGDYLTAEQKAGIDPNFIRSGRGFDPDDLTRMFGYPSTEALIRDLKEAEEVRRQHGLGPDAWKSSLVDAEVEGRLEKEFGPLERNILEEAREFVVSPTTLDRVYAELENVGKQAGVEIEDYAKFKQAVKAIFDETPVAQISSKGYLAAAGKAARKAEQAYLDGKMTDALAAKLENVRALHMANLATKLEKQVKAFVKTAKTFGKVREKEGIPQEYMNFIHDIYTKVGVPINRLRADLDKEIAAGSHKDLEAFWEAKEKDMQSMPIPEFLFEPYREGKNFSIRDMKASEFTAVHEAITSIIHNARDEGKIYKAGEARDFKEVKDEAVATLARLAERTPSYNKGLWAKGKESLEASFARLLQVEALLNRWDRGDHRGVFTQYISMEGAAAANDYSARGREISEMVRALPKVKMSSPIENNLIIGETGTPIKMTRENLLRVMMNMGSMSNWEKMVRGEAQFAGVDPAIFEGQLHKWVMDTAKPEDWEFVQGWFDIFKKIKGWADTMERGQSGVPAEDVPAVPIDTPHGTYGGGYSPMIYDRLRLKPTGKEKSSIEDSTYVRASTPKRYTKERTGYFAPIDLHMDSLPNYVSQMLRDISFRPFIKNASKLIYDNDFGNAVTKHYGPLYRDMLKDWLEDIANNRNSDTRNASFAAATAEALRTNLVSSLIGFNPGTIMKHGITAGVNSLLQIDPITGVNPVSFMRTVIGLTSGDARIADLNNKFAMESSEELQRRHQHWAETLGGANDLTLGKMNWRQTIAYYGSKGVAFSDLLSSRATWLTAYRQEAQRLLAEGQESFHGDAVRYADKLVRDTHGSTAITSRPEMMRQRGWAKWLTSLYGFFSHIFQRQYEIAWRSKDAFKKAFGGDLKGVLKDLPRIVALVVGYVIAPALIEEWVSPTPETLDKHKSLWAVKAALVIGGGMASSVPIARDIAHAILRNSDASLGLMGTEVKDLVTAQRHFTGKEAFRPRNLGRNVEDLAALAGLATGFPLQVGRTAKFGINYAKGYEHPAPIGSSDKTRRSVLGGIWHGTAKVPPARR